ncbi:hypothetical protein EW145_g5282 [Phellinidium pouzarii]|uniref:Uncharacterized protein n=1 Tax=Phellinidium pouzarii TaxID=167371 RepID=A0A4S4L0Q3_9AGAM|nr:hypothetical protein EW145_g5282 [Phellinidium pouzarii]
MNVVDQFFAYPFETDQAFQVDVPLILPASTMLNDFCVFQGWIIKNNGLRMRGWNEGESSGGHPGSRKSLLFFEVWSIQPAYSNGTIDQLLTTLSSITGQKITWEDIQATSNPETMKDNEIVEEQANASIVVTKQQGFSLAETSALIESGQTHLIPNNKAIPTGTSGKFI